MPGARQRGRQRYIRSPHLHTSCGQRIEIRWYMLTGIERQERAKANQPKGKLGRDLAKERAQTRTGTLENVSQDERRRRDADQTSQAINYN